MEKKTFLQFIMEDNADMIAQQELGVEDDVDSMGRTSHRMNDGQKQKKRAEEIRAAEQSTDPIDQQILRLRKQLAQMLDRKNRQQVQAEREV